MRWERGANVGDLERFRALCDLLGHAPDRYRPLREKLRDAGLGPVPKRATRETESPDLERLVARLTGDGTARSARSICVTGTGAPDLVARVVWDDRVSGVYDGIGWLRCAGDAADLAALRMALAEAMGMDDELHHASGLSDGALRAAFLDRLCADERRVLVVLDGVTSVEVIDNFVGGVEAVVPVVVVTDDAMVAAQFGDGVVCAAGARRSPDVRALSRSDVMTRLVSAIAVLGERRFTASWVAGLASLPEAICEGALEELRSRDVVRAATPDEDASAGLPRLYQWCPDDAAATLISPPELAAARGRLATTARMRADALEAAPAAQRVALFARTRGLWNYALQVIVQAVTTRLGGAQLSGGPDRLVPSLESARIMLAGDDDAIQLPDIISSVARHLAARPFQPNVRRALRAGYVAAIAQRRGPDIVGRLAALIAAHELPDFVNALPWLDTARAALASVGSRTERARVSDQLSEARASCGDVSGSYAAAKEALALTPADAGTPLAIRMNNAGLMALAVAGPSSWEATATSLTAALDACGRNDAAAHHTRAVIRWNLAVLTWGFGGGESPELPLQHADNEVLSNDALSIGSTLCAAGALPSHELRKAMRRLATTRGAERRAVWTLGALAFHGHHYLVHAASMRATGEPAQVPLIGGQLGLYATPPATAPESRLAILYDPRGAVSAMDEPLLRDISALAARVAGPDDASTRFIETMRAAVARGEAGAG